MGMPDGRRQADGAAFQLGQWQVDPSLRTVTSGNNQVTLQPRVMHLLTYLAGADGRVVSRSELLDEVWSGVVVNDEAVSRAISELRKALDDDIKKPRYIQTIPKSGYRLLIPSPPGKNRYALIGVVAAVLLVLGIAMQFINQQPDEAAQMPLATSFLTSYPGREIDPAIDASGERVVFAWSGGAEGEEYDLFVRRIGIDDEPVNLTETPGFEGHPSWSPDGNTVAFVRGSGDGAAVWSVSWNGEDQRKLFDLDHWSFGLDWFPDGRSLVVSQQRDDGTHRLVRVFLDAADTQDLTSPANNQLGDYKPAVSPDGAWVAFVRGRQIGGQDVFVVNVNDIEERQLSRWNGDIRGVDWSPDSRSVIYSTDRGDGFGLWRVEIASGETERMLVNDRGIANPAIAANGVIIFESESYQENLWRQDLIADARGLHADRLNTHSTKQESYPSVSPDGKWLAFISNRTGKRSLLLTEFDETNQRVLTQAGQPVAATPVWSPDSKQIAISLAGDDGANTQLVDIQTGRARPLLKQSTNAIPIAWSRDGQHIYLSVEHQGQWGTWSVKPDGSGLSRLAIEDSIFVAEDESGEVLYYTTAADANLYKLPLPNDGSRNGALLVGELGIGYRLPWQFAAGSIYSIVAVDDQFEFARFNPATEAMESIATPPGLHFNSKFSVSPDGRHVIYSRTEESESDLKILDP
jgi:Tol biopolymer transport system component/DNA-binding winged helix-turn-helix (wHTH) protein